MKSLNVAIVYDRVNKFGGAERVLMALHELWPKAPLFTAVYDQKHAQWASIFRVTPSFLQHVPFAKRHHELYPWLTPLAFESFAMDGYDVVLSVTSAEAKNVLTKPGTVHICYCLTPTRYLWSGYEQYYRNPNVGLPGDAARFVFRHLVPTLRKWDAVASGRPDAYIAISDTVARRIETYYKRHAERVIYPPVDVQKFRYSGRKSKQAERYFLCVSRLVPYKRVDIVVDAFNELNLPLIIIGDGVDRVTLQKRAKPNIRFLRSVSDGQLAEYYRNAQAFIFAGTEDFGIAAVEAQASGTPVIAYGQGGVAEVVINGKTGKLFESQSASSLADALKTFTKEWYDGSLCTANAKRFSKERFKRKMLKTVEELYNKYV